ncbi:SusC/RagA family TonB-linked outer membrane protein [Pedobacter sp. AW1-32]|uniref:SusC/RagA family TonB-linked outer membrane protein n=1 Tax=Pedobacter sp. AW1-32 TaxID=3383026 RepID=UPI003FEF16ED
MNKLYNKARCKKISNSARSHLAKIPILFCLLILSSIGVFAQGIKITGTVKDKNGGVLPGVSIKVKIGQSATLSSAEGKFTIQVPGNQSVLIFSYIGYSTKEVPVGNATTLNVTLIEDDNDLDEVVVVGYGVQKKVNVIGSVATISSKSIEDRPVTNLSSSLAGLASGVNVRQGNGRPGQDGATIRVRGTGTINNNNALVVIDGIIGTMDAVNPNDVESVSILKDAAAASIYGSAAANGVILITTRKGANKTPTFSYTGIVSITNPTNIPGYVSDFIQYASLRNEAAANVGQAAIYPQQTFNDWAAANANPNGLTPQGIPNYVAYPNTDWGKEIFSTNLLQQHNVALNGGSEATQYAVSANYLNNPGTMNNSGSTRYQLRMNLQTKVAKFITVGTQTFLSLRENGKANTDNAFNYLKQTSPSVYPYYDGRYGFSSASQDGASNSLLTYLDGTGGKDQENRLNSTLFLKLDLMKGLSLESKVNYQNRYREQTTYTIPLERWNFATNVLSAPAAVPSTLTTSYAFDKDYMLTFDNVLRYETVIAKDHTIGAMVGYNQYYYNFYNTSETMLGLIAPDVTTFNSATTMQSITGGEYDWAMRSYFGRLNYGYKGKYLIEGVWRYDGSSRFAPDTRWGFFPAVSAGWRISEEKFMEGTRSFLDDLKLRLSYGITGNNKMSTDDSQRNYDYLATYGTSRYSFNNALANGLAVTTFANPGLVWEESASTNIGLDGSLFKGKLKFELDLYRRYTTDILTQPTIPLTAGTASAPTVNSMDVNNKGVELMLSHTNKIGDLSLTVSANGAYNVNKVENFRGTLSQGFVTDANGNRVFTSNLGIVSSGTNERVIEGHSLNEFYLYNVYRGTGTYNNPDGSVNINGGPVDGMIRTPADLDWVNRMIAAGYRFGPVTRSNNTDGTPNKAGLYYGDFIYADNNGDGTYGGNYDQSFTGKSSVPKFTFGLSLNLQYKNFDLSMIWSGAAGMWYYYATDGFNSSVTRTGFSISSMVANDHYYYNDRNPNDPANNVNGTFPRLKVDNDNQNRDVASDFYLYNASYAKLKNLQIGYTFPHRLSKKLALSRLRVYLLGENLVTITKYPGIDPELGATFGYPTMRQYSLGLNLTF